MKRTELAEYLKQQGIITASHYVPLYSSHAGQLYGPDVPDVRNFIGYQVDERLTVAFSALL